MSTSRLQLRWLIVPAAALFVLPSCGSDGPTTPATGTIEATVSTTGEDIDPDGYTVTVNSSNDQSLTVNGTSTVSNVSEGAATVELTGVADNCTVAGDNPRTVQVTGGQTATTAFDVSCVAREGSVEVTTATTGDDLDADGYTVELDGTSLGTIGINETKTFSGIDEGTYTLSLSGVAANCTVASNDQSVTVEFDGTATATFDVDCSSTTGDLDVTTSTSGQDLDPDGYTVTLDPGTANEESQSIGTDATVTFAGRTTGDHVVELSDVADNCTVSGDNPRTVNVPEGGGSTTFDVSCVDAVGDLSVDASTTGDQTDSDGYTLTVENAVGTVVRPLSPNGTEDFSNLDGGDYTVQITGIANNCWVDGDNPRTETVTHGQTTSTTFDVKCFAPLLDHVVFDSDRLGNSEIYTMDPSDPGTQTNLTQNPASDWKPSLSPDGTTIAFNSTRGGPGNHIMLMNADGSNVRNLHNGGIGPIFSPDGSRIAFEWKNDVWIMNVNGSGLQNLTNDSNVWDALPDWKPDGSRIAFTSERNGGDVSTNEIDIWVIDVDGSNLEQLTSSTGLSGNAAWSPDGAKLTFSRLPVGGVEDVYIMDADGTNQVNLTNLSGSAQGMSDWMPDGSKVIYVSDEVGNSEIFSMDPDGMNQTNLTNNLSEDDEPQAGGGG